MVAKEDKLRGEVTKAYIVTKQPKELTVRQVKVYCRNQFANYKIPREVEFVNKLPKNATGKIDKQQLN